MDLDDGADAPPRPSAASQAHPHPPAEPVDQPPAAEPAKRTRRRAAAGTGTRRRTTMLHHVHAPAALLATVEAMAQARGCELSALLNAALLLGRDRLAAAAAEAWEAGGTASCSVRLPVGLSETEIVGAMRLALRMCDAGRYDLADRYRDDALAAAWGQERAVMSTRLEQLSQAVEKLAFRPLSGGVRTPRHAAYILGFPDEVGLSEAVVTARFRQVAPLYHPDTGVISNGQQRVAQIIEARRVLLDSLRRR